MAHTGNVSPESAPSRSEQVVPRRRRRQLLGAAIADVLRERVAGLEPGTDLSSEAELSAEFDVSARVVRDALRALATEGIIETSQGKRAKVAHPRPVAITQFFHFVISSGGAITDLLDVRLAIETQAGRAAAQRATVEQVHELRALLDAVVAAGDDVDARADADIAFHRAIAEASGNRFFIAILDALEGALRDERGQGAKLPVSHEVTDAQHRELLRAIEEGNAEEAEHAMRTILVRARDLWSADAGADSRPSLDVSTGA